MKKSILVLAIMLATGSAYATPLVDNSTNLSAGAKAFAGAAAFGQGGQGIGGNSTTTVEAGDYGDLRITPSAIAPSVSTNVICPMVLQGSAAGSVWFASGSGTTGPEVVALCVAWHLGQKEVVEQLTCKADKHYREVNLNCW